MKGFKALDSTETTLAGIELHHMLRTRQHLKAEKQSLNRSMDLWPNLIQYLSILLLKKIMRQNC